MKLETLTSRTGEHVKFAVKLRKSAAERRQSGLFFAEGKRLCEDLAANFKPAVLFVSDNFLKQNPENSLVLSCEKAADCKCFLADDFVMEKICETKSPQGMAAVFACAAQPKQLFLQPENKNNNPVIFCENLQDPANAGGLIRSAAALGFGTIIFSKNSADVYSQKALRASMGALGRINVRISENFYDDLQAVREQGFTVYAAALQGAKAVNELKAEKPFALLIGNEGNGLSEKALQLSSQRVYIPMQNGVESLNAGVAGALLMYYFKNLV